MGFKKGNRQKRNLTDTAYLVSFHPQILNIRLINCAVLRLEPENIQGMRLKSFRRIDCKYFCWALHHHAKVQSIMLFYRQFF